MLGARSGFPFRVDALIEILPFNREFGQLTYLSIVALSLIVRLA